MRTFPLSLAKMGHEETPWAREPRPVPGSASAFGLPTPSLQDIVSKWDRDMIQVPVGSGPVHLFPRVLGQVN